jgi:hypothetical protein
MLHAAARSCYTYCHQTLSIIAQDVPLLFHSATTMISRIALQVIISYPLLRLQNNLFGLGFAIGFIFNEKVREVVERINVIYSVCRPAAEERILVFCGGFFALYFMSNSISIATLYYSARWGVFFRQLGSSESTWSPF